VGAGEGKVGVGGIGDIPSAIESRDSAKDEDEALCRIGAGTSATESLRACG